MLLRALSFILLLAIFFNISVTTEPVSCPVDDYYWLNFTNYHHCRYQPDEFGHMTNTKVKCEILNKLIDYTEFADHTLHIHVKLEFEVIGPPVNDVTMCLKLSGISAERIVLNKLWNNASIGELSTNFYNILRFVKDGFIRTKFKNDYPSGLLHLNLTCLQPNMSCNPIRHATLRQSIDRPASPLDYFDGTFWQLVRKWYHTLGGYDTEMKLDFNPSFGVIKLQYISPIISYINMTYLRLTDSRWNYLDSSLLKNMSSLKVLDLSDNGIKYILNDTFLETPELEVLILADNSLKEVPSAITGLKMLRHIDLSNNEIKIQNGFEIITQLYSLKYLSLSHMQFNDLRSLESVLRSCNESEFQLHILNMSYCDIQSLNKQDFKCQKELKMIDLSHNKLTEIPSEIVSEQQNLISLNISNNLINKGPNFIFHNNLTRLDISNNRLYDVSNLVATCFVEFLDLSKNNISSWSNKNVFHDKVTNLNLSGNSINYASKEMINSFKNLKSVDLGENLFDCLDCSLPEFQKWLGSENSTDKVYNNGKKDELTCSVPAIDRGRNIVDIDFDMTLCITDYTTAISVSIAVIFIVITIGAVVAYFYRFEMTYLTHLVAVKWSNNNLANSTETYKYDAFVCYSGEDRAWVVGELLPTLESSPNKYKLCLHDRDFPVGAYITRNIVSSLQESKKTIVVLTDKFVKSKWCRLELEFANHKLFEDRQDFLILLEFEKLDRSALPRHLKYLMDTRTYLEWPKNNQNTERAWSRLKEALGPSMRNNTREININGYYKDSVSH